MSMAWRVGRFRLVVSGRAPSLGGDGPLTWKERASIMPDVGFVLLTVALFAGLAMMVRAVERL
jgi:hypothetical protein